MRKSAATERRSDEATESSRSWRPQTRSLLTALIKAALREPWVMAKGARTFVAAVLRGDIAPLGDSKRRLDICRKCEARVTLTVLGAMSPSDWCGDPERGFIPGKQCGCLLAGKTRIASEECPRKLWGAVQRGR